MFGSGDLVYGVQGCSGSEAVLWLVEVHHRLDSVAPDRAPETVIAETQSETIRGDGQPFPTLLFGDLASIRCTHREGEANRKHCSTVLNCQQAGLAEVIPQDWRW